MGYLSFPKWISPWFSESLMLLIHFSAKDYRSGKIYIHQIWEGVISAFPQFNYLSHWELSSFADLEVAKLDCLLNLIHFFSKHLFTQWVAHFGQILDSNMITGKIYLQAMSLDWAMAHLCLSNSKDPSKKSSYACASSWVTLSAFYTQTECNFFAHSAAFFSFFMEKNRALAFWETFREAENFVSLAKAQFFSALKSKICRILLSSGFYLAISFLMNFILVPNFTPMLCRSLRTLCEQYLL